VAVDSIVAAVGSTAAVAGLIVAEEGSAAVVAVSVVAEEEVSEAAEAARGVAVEGGAGNGRL
jgi:hypothetical protein